MQASKSTIMSLIGSNYTQFKVPIYQRTYDWKTKHCEKLVKDIFAAMEHHKEHFTGSIVYLNEVSFSQEKISLIIDGQQRITTVIIILKALANLAKKFNHEMMKNQILDKYLLTDTKDFKKVNKLIPTDEDEEQFELLMNNRFKEMNQDSGLYKNYIIIYGMLESHLKNEDNLVSFYSTLIDKMTIVELVLDKGIDDPQEIFESINSTGLELSQADLIRNFLLMSASDQDYLYRTYWKPLFGLFGQEKLEDFMFNYLIYKTQRRIKYGDIYNVFINNFEESNVTREEIMNELFELGKIYYSFINETHDYSSEVSELLQGFNYLDQTTIFPFLLKVFVDFKNEIITEEELIKILKLFLSYHVKRIVTGVASGSARGLYINLYNRIFKLPENKIRYYDSIATFMYDLKTHDEIPSDYHFVNNLLTMDIYRQRKVAKYMLSKLENYNFKEQILTDELTVEHVMPQTLTASWRKMLGNNHEEIHENYLHTLGNLTLTGYNSTLSNKSFDEKKETLIKYSKANHLNKDILNCEIWNEKNIITRTKRLGEEILKIFEVPEHDGRGLRFEAVEEFDLNYNYEEIKGRRAFSIKFIDMDKEIKTNNFRNMLIEVIHILDNIDSRKMDDIAADLFNPWESGKNDKISNFEGLPNNQYHQKLRDNLYLVGGFSSAGVIESIRKLMNLYNIDENQFVFYLRVSE